MNRTFLIFHPDHLQHETGEGHPERPWRADRTAARLRRANLGDRLAWQSPDPADRGTIERVHDPLHVARVESACRNGMAFLDADDTRISAGSGGAALLAAGAGPAAADAVISGAARNAFVLCRPPGHHAKRAAAMGFCLFNNVAVSARYLQTVHGLERVFIVDWDVHHGNGTQHIFEADPTVFTFSVHQWPLYPGTGRADEIGIDAGRGTVRNVPLAAGHGDDTYLRVFREELAPALEKFRPDIILVSAGFDAHRADPLGGMEVTTDGFAALTRLVVDWSRDLCGGRLISFLEGGYDEAALPECVEIHVRGLLDTGGLSGREAG
jgi:acetoin utilization deacetylase AcuC-like enzyme